MVPTLRSDPSLVPKRAFLTQKGVSLMFSVPPHKTTSASLTQISYLKIDEQQQNSFIMTEVSIKQYVLSSKLIVNLISNLS